MWLSATVIWKISHATPPFYKCTSYYWMNFCLISVYKHATSVANSSMSCFTPCREYWMIYRRPAFLAVLWFGSYPTPSPLFGSKSSLSFCFLCLPVFFASRAYWAHTTARKRVLYNHSIASDSMHFGYAFKCTQKRYLPFFRFSPKQSLCSDGGKVPN